MALQDILNDLIANNAKAGGFYSVDQLKNLITNASVDVSGAQLGVKLKELKGSGSK